MASFLTAQEIETAQAAGAAWGAMEAETYRDQNPGRDLPEWTLGTWCGHNPMGCRGEVAANEYESVLDEAARDAWNAAR